MTDLRSLQDAPEGDKDDSLRSRVHELLEVHRQGPGLPALHHTAVDEVRRDGSQSSHDEGVALGQDQTGAALQFSDGNPENINLTNSPAGAGCD